MAESTALCIAKFNGMDYKSGSLEIEILLEQKQLRSLVDNTEEAPGDATSTRIMEEAAWNRAVHHSPRDGEVCIAAVCCSDRREGNVGSAEGELQI